jgi:hypothetical protein
MIVSLAIAQGQQIEIYRRSDPYGSMGVGALQVHPLQMIYSDVAWYSGSLFRKVQADS